MKENTMSEDVTPDDVRKRAAAAGLALREDRLESVRLAPDLKERSADAMDALRAAAERTEAAW